MIFCVYSERGFGVCNIANEIFKCFTSCHFWHTVNEIFWCFNAKYGTLEYNVCSEVNFREQINFFKFIYGNLCLRGWTFCAV
jgi:hypothetical protein